MNNENGSLDTLIETKLNEDNDFQESIKDLSDEEKETKVNERKSQLLQEEATALWEKAEKATKAEELANNYKTRAEKAEQELKKFKKPDEGEPTPTKQGDDLTSKDLYALMQAQVHQEDVDEVIKASKLLGKDIKEALKDPVVQSILSTKKEYRETAEATNTGKSKTGSKTPTGAELLKGLKKGEVPERGSKEAEDLFWAKRGGKR